LWQPQSINRAFQVTADVPEIYMQEFWATAKLHHNSIRFKIDTKKSVLDLEAFREMLHISPRILNQSFADLSNEEEILDFLRFLGHSYEIRYLTDVNVNKLYQPWRLFASVINKCLTGKSSGVDSFRLSQSQMLWGFYHRINIDFAYLIWEDFVYQVEHKNQKRSNEMYYPRFTKVIIDNFMTRKPYISRRNRINWHYVRDDVLFSTIKVVSRHQTTQQYGAILPIELTTDEIKNSKAYKEYYACAMGEAAPKPKASAKKKKGESASPTTPPTPTPTTTVESAPRLSATAKGIDSLFESTPQVDVQASTTVAPLTLTAPTLPPPTIPTISQVPQAPTPPTTALSTFLQDLPNFGSLFGFNHHLKTLEANFSKFMQTSQFAGVVSYIPGIVERYIDQRMNEVVKVAVQIQSDSLQDEAQAKNEEFLDKLDENIQKIIKEQVKEQVKVQVSKILPKIEKTMNEQLEAKVLTRSSNSSKTSYAVAADLSKMELKKILIEKMESNKPGPKRRREGKEPESTSAPKEKATKTTGKSTEGSKSYQKTASKSAPAEEPMQTTQDLEDPSHQEFETDVADDQPIAEASQHLEWFHKQKKPPTPDHA
nr:hypothetical protein [Tanacetum cinerariifolium]